MDLSFSGAGFMGCYYFGVVNCWNKYIPHDRVNRVAGASAGSLIAAYYLMDLPLDSCLKLIIDMTEDIRRRPLGVFDRSNQIVDVLPACLDQMFPEDAHKRVNGRLFVCMTRLKDMKCVIVNQFNSKADLIEALNCSCFIPVWSGNHVSTFRGVKHIDGGFSNNLPVFDEHTIRICCFSGASDIALYDRARMSGNLQGMPFNLSWKNLRRAGRALWPPPPSFIIELLERGFHDTKDFILSNDLIQCNKCYKAIDLNEQPIYTRVSPTISPAPSPTVSRANSYMNLSDLQRAGSFRRRASKQDKTLRAALASQLELSEQERKCSARIPSLFDTDRSKSGKTIKAKALEKGTRAGERKSSSPSVSFAAKLRAKLTRVASKSPSNDSAIEVVEESPPVPTIVVDQPEDVKTTQSDDDDDDEEEQFKSIIEIMEEQEGESSSASTSACEDSHSRRSDESCDSALGKDVATATTNSTTLAYMKRRRDSQSPAEKFLASRKMSLAALAQQHEEDEAEDFTRHKSATHLLGGDRFAFAPNPLPSCPPSPNLNRHCTECIRARQQARMDELDEKIKCEAERYKSLESTEPEKEFSSVRHKLTAWFRTLGAPKYSYSFGGVVGGAAQDGEQLTDEQLAELAKSAPRQRRPSEIPTI